MEMSLYLRNGFAFVQRKAIQSAVVILTGIYKAEEAKAVDPAVNAARVKVCENYKEMWGAH